MLLSNTKLITLHAQLLQFLFLLGEPPDIDKGPFVPPPTIFPKETQMVNIGTPVYIFKGYDVIINCNIVNGTRPINIMWLHNGEPEDPPSENTTITITDAQNGDVFMCRADNSIGFDEESTTIHVEGNLNRIISLYTTHIMLC